MLRLSKVHLEESKPVCVYVGHWQRPVVQQLVASAAFGRGAAMSIWTAHVRFSPV